MTQEKLNGIWNYYLSLERDMANTSQYIEPLGQENVYSFEFAKLLILSCTEVESLFKIVCSIISPNKCAGNIAAYKEIILDKYPNIIDAKVSISRLNTSIKPFDNWDTSKLIWWDAYQDIKHNRGKFFPAATYMNAVTALSALYVLIFYISEITNTTFNDYKSEYITSEYSHPYLFCAPNKKLPDFQ